MRCSASTWRLALLVSVLTGVYILGSTLVSGGAGKSTPVLSTEVVLVDRDRPGFQPDHTITVEKKPSTPVAGVFSPNLCVCIRNNASSEAIALRGVYWSGYRMDGRRWVGQDYGPAHEDKQGSIVHNTMAQSSSGLEFEDGLILPGEEMLVSTPMTPQRDGKGELVVRYVVVASGKDWMRDVFLLAGHEGVIQDIYKPATPELVSLRKGKGGEGLARATLKPDAKGPTEREMRFDLQIPVKVDTSGVMTGGLSADAAAIKAGIVARGHYLAFYRAPVKSWFFIYEDRKAVALRKQSGGWIKVDVPDMDVSTPDEFGKYSDGKTAMILRPEAFGDILSVNKPGYEGPGYYAVGETMVPPDKFWAVMERARKKGMDLHLATYDSNGLGNETRLIAGVKLDVDGRWLDPNIGPR